MDPGGSGAGGEDSPRSWRGPRPARAFLILGGVGALLFAALTPPLGNPDEPVHLARTYLLSEGHIAVPGRAPRARTTVPRSLIALERRLGHSDFRKPPRRFRAEEITALFAQPLAPDDRIQAAYPGTYGPLAYAPQALALLPGRLAGLSPVALMYLGRLGNVAAYLLAGWIALRLAPRRRLALALLLLVPMSVSQASSLSADVPTYGLALVFVTLCWRLALEPGAQVGRREAFALVALAALLGLAKPGYWLLLGVFGLIPATRFGSPARRRGIGALTVAAGLVPSLLWLAGALAADPVPASIYANPAAQMHHLLAQPLDYVAVLARSLKPHVTVAFYGGVGVLGHANILLPGVVYLLVPLAVVAATLLDDPDPPQLDLRRRALLVAIFAASALLLLTIAYVAWNPVGTRLVFGVQGRYYAPVLPLLLLAMPVLPPAWQPQRGILRLLCVVASGTSLLLALQAMLVAFYR